MDALLRVPLETQRINLKATQFHIERELTTIADKLNHGMDEKQRLAIVDKLKAMQQRLATIQASQEASNAQFNTRKQFIDTVGSDVSQQLPVYIGEYLLRSNYRKSAEALCKAYNLDDLLDAQLMNECMEIVDSIRLQDSSLVLAWCNQSRVFLRKVGSSLEFDARRQHFFQLCGKSKPEAISYARKHLGKFLETQFSLLSQSVLRLVDDTQTPPGWDALEKQFVKVFLEMHGKDPYISLFDLVSVGLSALRTRNCSPDIPRQSRHHNQSLKDHMCPACSKDLGILAQSVPFAHHTKSNLDPEMVLLPNGRCYGLEVLRELSRQVGVESPNICDPATQEIFDERELRSIYPS